MRSGSDAGAPGRRGPRGPCRPSRSPGRSAPPPYRRARTCRPRDRARSRSRRPCRRTSRRPCRPPHQSSPPAARRAGCRPCATVSRQGATTRRRSSVPRVHARRTLDPRRPHLGGPRRCAVVRTVSWPRQVPFARSGVSEGDSCILTVSAGGQARYADRHRRHLPRDQHVLDAPDGPVAVRAARGPRWRGADPGLRRHEDDRRRLPGRGALGRVRGGPDDAGRGGAVRHRHGGGVRPADGAADRGAARGRAGRRRAAGAARRDGGGERPRRRRRDPAAGARRRRLDPDRGGAGPAREHLGRDGGAGRRAGGLRHVPARRHVRARPGSRRPDYQDRAGRPADGAGAQEAAADAAAAEAVHHLRDADAGVDRAGPRARARAGDGLGHGGGGLPVRRRPGGRPGGAGDRRRRPGAGGGRRRRDRGAGLGAAARVRGPLHAGRGGVADRGRRGRR